MAHYEALAIRLASAPAELAALRTRLAGARERCALFDTPRFVRHLESAYEEMSRQRLQGGAPAMIG